MKRMLLSAAVAALISTLGATAPALAGPRCGPHAHWVPGHYGPHHHWHPGHCV